MSVFDPIKPYLSLIKTGLFVACVAAAFVYGCSRGHQSGVADGEAKVRSTEVKQANDRAKAAEESLRLEREASKRYQTRAEAKAAEAETYRKLYNEANARRDRDVSALNAGTLKLRRQWQGCEARVSEAGRAAPGEPDPDGDTQLRHEGAADLVRNADQCDAWILSLQESARSDRK